MENLLTELYNNHSKNYSIPTYSNAIFVDRNGNAMTNRTYRDQFNNVKKVFLNKLEKSAYRQYQDHAFLLRQNKWSPLTTYLFCE